MDVLAPPTGGSSLTGFGGGHGVGYSLVDVPADAALTPSVRGVVRHFRVGQVVSTFAGVTAMLLAMLGAALAILLGAVKALPGSIGHHLVVHPFGRPRVPTETASGATSLLILTAGDVSEMGWIHTSTMGAVATPVDAGHVLVVANVVNLTTGPLTMFKEEGDTVGNHRFSIHPEGAVTIRPHMTAPGPALGVLFDVDLGSEPVINIHSTTIT